MIQNWSSWAIAGTQLTKLMGSLSKLREPTWSKLSTMIQSQEKCPKIDQMVPKFSKIATIQLN